MPEPVPTADACRQGFRRARQNLGGAGRPGIATPAEHRRPVVGPDRVSRGLAGQARKLMAEMRPCGFMYVDRNRGA
jgi:hypothetical protein